MHVHVNAAVSADGKLSTRRREQIAISGDDDFARVDRLRASVDGVVVGVGTVLADDPSLVRHDESHRVGAAPPARIVADSNCRTPVDAAILEGEPRTYVLTSAAAPEDRRSALEAAGASVRVTGSERVDLSRAFEALRTDGIDRLLVEGGGELIFSLFEDELVDELTVFVGPTIIGGRDAPTLVDGDGFLEAFPELELVDVERIDDGVLLTWRP